MSSITPPPTLSSWSAAFFTKLHRYRALVKRRWYVPLLTLSVGLCIQAYRFAQIQPTYISSGKLIVSPRMFLPENAVVSDESVNFIGTQLELMQSAEVRSRARARVQALKPNLVPIPVALSAYQQPRTSIFTLQASGSEPNYTQAFLDAVMEEYISRRKETRSEKSQSALLTIKEQVDKSEKEINQVDEEMLSFQKENNVIFMEEQGNKNATYLINLSKQLDDLNTEFQLLSKLTLDQNIERRSTNTSKPQTTTKNPATTNTAEKRTPDSEEIKAAAGDLLSPESEYRNSNQQIQLLLLQRDELSQYLKPKHPKIIALNAEIQRQQTLLDMFKKQSIEQLNNRREGLRLQIQNLQELIKSEEVKALDVNRRMADYQRMKSKRQRLQAFYERLVSSVQSVDLSQNIDQEMISIMEHPGLAQPVHVGMSGMLLNGFLLGLLAGVGILFLLDRIDDRINSFTELRDHFEEPVLGQIPMDPTLARKKGGPSLLVQDDRRHVYAESFRNVRSSLLFMAIDGTRPKTLLITSAIPNEGKSTFASNLAITMAFAGSRVLLVDADLRRGRIHDAFSVSNQRGLSDVLSNQMNWRDAIQESAAYHFHIIPRGPTPPNPGELFLSSLVPSIFQEMRDEYDYVVVDSAPILATDDTASLAPKLDGTIFLMRTSYTSARLSRNAMDLLYQRQVNILGLVMNFVDTNLPEYYYYQYKEYYNRGAKAS
ncbi:MAG: hypothetical protein B9S32_09490 [Verrucomicrobia bacterium Tous-C9LFEB]|nr:MAG: hypothetical protein B9S32_09490 [Verrucomicrobia bacterium Tous-C9LFEB]